MDTELPDDIRDTVNRDDANGVHLFLLRGHENAKLIVDLLPCLKAGDSCLL